MGKPKPELRSKWSGLISEQSESGETVEAFCRERGLITSQFYTWRKRLRRSAAEQFLEVQIAKTAARPMPSKRGAIEERLAEPRQKAWLINWAASNSLSVIQNASAYTRWRFSS